MEKLSDLYANPVLQIINHQDNDWDDNLAKFTAAGFTEIVSGQLKDDIVIERLFSVLQEH